ncbi:hypothetical protein KPL35_15300 [Clostridium sp. CF011]|uniref:hypothetical protein n=1 Tax=Clostridium sp. CF011 TaxID=2843318 RepID=UPI001C0BC72A|nr:hypothetical protein [Clostridium sp. CF011]MBU3093429.1 hypothetical protein [Clostridium sp. CF011]WAG71274.1 hypothetical protein LL036_07675 [Clostridium sp. CF011]
MDLLEKRFYANALFDKIEIVEQMLETYEKLKNKNKILLDSNFCNINMEGSKSEIERTKETSNELEQFTELGLDQMNNLKIGILVRYIIKK